MCINHAINHMVNLGVEPTPIGVKIWGPSVLKKGRAFILIGLDFQNRGTYCGFPLVHSHYVSKIPRVLRPMKEGIKM